MMLQHKWHLFTYSNEKLFPHELKILNYVVSWENKKASGMKFDASVRQN